MVGNASRPITDRLRISREKLAYIVDSTAASIAAIALISTWVGDEIALIDDSIQSIAAITATGFSLFVQSIASNFYPILSRRPRRNGRASRRPPMNSLSWNSHWNCNAS